MRSWMNIFHVCHKPPIRFREIQYEEQLGNVTRPYWLITLPALRKVIHVTMYFTNHVTYFVENRFCSLLCCWNMNFVTLSNFFFYWNASYKPAEQAVSNFVYSLCSTLFSILSANSRIYSGQIATVSVRFTKAGNRVRGATRLVFPGSRVGGGESLGCVPQLVFRAQDTVQHLCRFPTGARIPIFSSRNQTGFWGPPSQPSFNVYRELFSGREGARALSWSFISI
jgi:hypothetical protein